MKSLCVHSVPIKSSMSSWSGAYCSWFPYAWWHQPHSLLYSDGSKGALPTNPPHLHSRHFPRLILATVFMYTNESKMLSRCTFTLATSIRACYVQVEEHYKACHSMHKHITCISQHPLLSLSMQPQTSAMKMKCDKWCER